LLQIISDKVEAYLNQLMPIEDPFLAALQQQGIEQDIPIIQVPSIRLIELLINIVQPKTIIEIGTAIGFSAIWMAKAKQDVIIHTIERKEAMIELAKENIKAANLASRIILHEGEAVDILPTLPPTEMVFIDAAKGKYREFFQLTYPLVKVGGLFVFDNVLFRGYVADDEVVKSKPMLRKIKAFNQFLAEQPQITTSFIPIGDGLALAYKLEE